MDLVPVTTLKNGSVAIQHWIQTHPEYAPATH
jgi:hypothetical protein